MRKHPFIPPWQIIIILIVIIIFVAFSCNVKNAKHSRQQEIDSINELSLYIMSTSRISISTNDIKYNGDNDLNNYVKYRLDSAELGLEFAKAYHKNVKIYLDSLSKLKLIHISTDFNHISY